MDIPAGGVVYLVDDDEAVRDSTRALLESYDLTIREYPSAQAFLAGFGGEQKGCLLLDLHMPGLGGLELLEALRARGLTLPVIILTGRGDSALAERAARAGAMVLLHKPVDNDELVRSIGRALAPGVSAHRADRLRTNT